MTIFVGADHRGFELKNKLVEYLHEQNMRVEDMGAYEQDSEDDYIDFARKVAEGILMKPQESMGLLVCGSGVGVCIGANRYKGIRAALAFDDKQVAHARTNDHVNVLCLPSEWVDFEKAKTFVDTFLSTSQNNAEKYNRRTKKLDQL